MVLSFIISWNRSKLLVPIGCSSKSLQRATSWGRSRCSNVSSSSNNLENRTMSFVVGCSPVPRTWQWHTGAWLVTTVKSPKMITALNFAVCSLPLWQTVCRAYPLNERGESLRFVLSLSFSFIPPGHLSNGFLEELGQLQFSCQTLLLLLLLQEETHINKILNFFIMKIP